MRLQFSIKFMQHTENRCYFSSTPRKQKTAKPFEINGFAKKKELIRIVSTLCPILTLPTLFDT